jgi:hypothetical protein
MGLIQIKQAVRGLSLKQLRRLDEWLHEFIEKAEESARADRLRSREQVVEERTVDNLTYRLEEVRCGKEKCKCSRGKLHGPYWYSYSRIEGSVKSKYIGKKLPPEIKKRLSESRDT